MTGPKHTPGPWRWCLNPYARCVSLESKRHVVMGFERWGMSRAAPNFRALDDIGDLRRVEHFGVVQPGREHHREWHQIIDHPDARLIAAAPRLYDLAHQYASECGECAGVGIKPDDTPCNECAFIRVILDEIDGRKP